MPQLAPLTLSALIERSDISALPDMPIITDTSITTARYVEENPESFQTILQAGAQHLPPFGLRRTDAFFAWQIKKNNPPYGAEMLDVAGLSNGTPGAITLNLSHDIACSTGIYTTPQGAPSLVRLLDWDLKMSAVTIALTRQGQGGDWMDISYPGFTGTVTAIGPHFAAAINRAPMPGRPHKIKVANHVKYAPPLVDDMISRIKTILSPHISPIHLLRQTFEQCVSFDEAVKKIVEAETSCSVIIPIAGKTADEAAIIYKDLDYCAISTFSQGGDKLRALFADNANVAIIEETSLAAANHWPVGYGLAPAHERRFTNSEGRVDTLIKALSGAKDQDIFERLHLSETDVDGLNVVSSTALVAELTPATRAIRTVTLQGQKLVQKPAAFSL